MLICIRQFFQPFSLPIVNKNISFFVDLIYLYFEWHLFTIANSMETVLFTDSNVCVLFHFDFFWALGFGSMLQLVVETEHLTIDWHAVKIDIRSGHLTESGKNWCLGKDWHWTCCDYSYHMNVINYFLCWFFSGVVGSSQWLIAEKN